MASRSPGRAARLKPGRPSLGRTTPKTRRFGHSPITLDNGGYVKLTAKDAPEASGLRRSRGPRRKPPSPRSAAASPAGGRCSETFPPWRPSQRSPRSSTTSGSCTPQRGRRAPLTARPLAAREIRYDGGRVGGDASQDGYARALLAHMACTTADAQRCMLGGCRRQLKTSPTRRALSMKSPLCLHRHTV